MESKIQNLYYDLVDFLVTSPSLNTVRERQTFFDLIGLSESIKQNVILEGALYPFVAHLLKQILERDSKEMLSVLEVLAEYDPLGEEAKSQARTLLEQVRQVDPEQWRLVFYLPDMDPDDILENYLRWTQSQHQYLQAPHAHVGHIELDRIYVALRGDQSNEHERSANREWLNELVEAYSEEVGFMEEDERDYIRWRILARSPITKTLEERDRPHLFSELNNKIVTLGEAFQKERRLVILGDPGSGKTTLARWLALRLAQGLLNQEQSLWVQAGQVDPQAINPTEKISLGPTRMPILIRVSEFAQEWNTYNGSLYEFIGHQTWGGRTPSYPAGHTLADQPIPVEALKWMMQYYIRRRQAVIILDGLDEISSFGNRDEVVQSINQFMTYWIDDLYEIGGDNEIKETPVEIGGNQLVVTSRITGYYASHLTGSVAHVTIEPMIDEAVAAFCDAWVTAVFDARTDNTSDLLTARQEAEGLKSEIFDPSRRGVRELASNPLLITVLASIYLDQRFNNPANQRAYLPEQRVELYNITVKNLAQVWKKRSLTGQTEYEDPVKVLAIMTPLAAYIHEHIQTGLLPFPEVKEQVTKNLMAYYGKEEISPEFENEALDFLHNLSSEVGLFTERGEYLYGFLHLTFQEYLTGCYLTKKGNDISDVKEQIWKWIDSPRWREPILLGLGYMSITWPQDAVRELLLGLIEEGEEFSFSLPRGALLVTAALREMRRISDELILEIACTFLQIYQDRDRKGRFVNLRKQLELAFDRLRYGPYIKVVDNFLVDSLSDPTAAPAVANLILVNKWFTPNLTKELIKALPYDSEAWQWVIHKSVEKIITQHIANNEFARRRLDFEEVDDSDWIPTSVLEGLDGIRCLMPRRVKHNQSVEFGQRPVESYNIPQHLFPFRLQLVYNPKFVLFIKHNSGYLRLVLALYGGFGSYNMQHVLDEYTEIKQELFFGGANGNRQLEMAVRLDTVLVPQVKSLMTNHPEFDIQTIYRDTPLTPIIIDALHHELSVEELIQRLLTEFRHSDEAIFQSDTLLALSALGYNISALLKETLPETITYLQQNVLRLKEYISDSVLRTSSGYMNMMKNRPEGVSPKLWQKTLGALIETGIAYGGEPKNTWELISETENFADKSIRTNILSETWMHAFSGAADDMVYNVAVILDTIGKHLTKDLHALAASFATANQTKNNQWPYHRGWQLEKIRPVHRNKAHLLMEGLEAISKIPKAIDFVRGWALGNLYPLISEEFPTLTAEVLIIAFSTLDNDSAFQSLTDALKELAPHLIHVDNPYDEIQLLIESISVPEHRARALALLAMQLSSQRNSYLERALAEAYEIEDPLRRAQMLEYLLPLMDLFRETILEEMGQNIDDIEDPNNRARMLLRLSFNYDINRRRKLIEQSLYAIDEIENEEERAETLQLMRSFVGIFPELMLLWEDICQKIKNRNHIRTAQGRFSHYLLDYYEHLDTLSLEETASWTTATLGAIIHDLSQTLEVTESVEQLWLQLKDDDLQPIALQKLKAQGIKSGLVLSTQAANQIEQLMDTNMVEPVSDLFPLLIDPEPECLPTLKHWFTQEEHEELSQYAALLLIESQQFDPDSLTSVVFLLGHQDDRTRNRAALALHGSLRADQIRASTIGYESMQRIKELSDEITQPRVKLVISWMEQRILHDDPGMIHHWASQVNGGADSDDMENSSHTALGVIRKIENVTLPVWALLSEYLENGPPTLKEAILEAVVRLAIIQWKDTYTDYEHPMFESLREQIRHILIESENNENLRVQAAEALGYVGQHEADFSVFQSVIEQEQNSRIVHCTLIELGRMIGRVSRRVSKSMLYSQYWIKLNTNTNKKNVNTKQLRFHKRLLEQASQHLAEVSNWRLLLESKAEESTLMRWAAEGLIWSSAPVPQVIEVIQHDPLTLLNALMGSCRTRYVSSQYQFHVQRASEYIEKQPILLDILLGLLEEHFARGNNAYTDSVPEYELSIKLSLAAAAAEQMPAKFLELSKKYDLRQSLAKAVTLHNTFPGRTASITLLSFMRSLETDVVEALQHALHDVYDVQNGALAAMIRFQDFTQDNAFLQKVLDDLYHKSPVNAYIMAQVLKIIGRNDTLSEEKLKWIVDSLVAAIDDPRSKRHVYIMDGNGAKSFRFNIRHMGRLDELFFETLTHITGLDTLYFASRISEIADDRVRKFEFPAKRGDEIESLILEIGEASSNDSPLQFQIDAFQTIHGLTVTNEASQNIKELAKIAAEKDVLLSDLLEHVITIAAKEKQS